MQDISEILKFQMAQENCSPLCALLYIKGDDNDEPLQSTKQQMVADANDKSRNKLGTRH